MSLRLTVVKRIGLGIGSCRLKCLGYLIRLSHKTYSAKRELLDGSNQHFGGMRARCSNGLENRATARLMVRFLVPPPLIRSYYDWISLGLVYA